MSDEIINKIEEIDENLHKWFKEKWVRFGPDGKIRGQCAREKDSEGKPKCRPLKSAQAMGKKARATAARRKRREDPNPDRSGKAKNVKTEEIMNENHKCPICGGELVSEALMNEKKDACYYKVKSRYKVWPSAYASGALVKCRKKGAKNWGTKSEGFEEVYSIAIGDTVIINSPNDKDWNGRKGRVISVIDNNAVIELQDTGGKLKVSVGQLKKQDVSEDQLNEKWSEKYKRSIDCSHPKGFSQRAHCQGRKKTEEQLMKEDALKKIIREMVEEVWNEQQAQQDECWECYESAMQESGTGDTPIENMSAEELAEYLGISVDDVKNDMEGAREAAKEKSHDINEGTNEAWEECYRKTNWDLVPEGDEHTCEGDEFYEIYGDINADSKENLTEAKYKGRTVKLGKPMRGDVKKFKVFVRNPKTGNVKKVNFGDKKMRIKKSNPKRRKSFRARHKCSSAKDRTSARYWSCRKW